MESFLKEQLKRIQDLAKQMSRLEKDAADLSHEFARQRGTVSYGPLADVKDFRTLSSMSDKSTRELRATADDRRRRPRRSPGRRRRRS